MYTDKEYLQTRWKSTQTSSWQVKAMVLNMGRIGLLDATLCFKRLHIKRKIIVQISKKNYANFFPQLLEKYINLYV